ncbi:hypothetical protein ABZ502_17565 [Streptomyces abikoensis]|uniref:hypothetical protein n=1 Tax=Streptomyces abikoensis TaxID=97398 RepID=UPI0033D2E30D
MNSLPLAQDELGAVALTMYDLGMLVTTSGMPAQPEPIPGREHECIAAQLGMPVVKLDDALRAYVDAHHAFTTWHPELPPGISAHKLATTGWIITAAEVTAALATLDRTSGAAARAAAEKRFTEHRVDLDVWDDWVKMLRGSADSGYPIHAADPDYEGPWMIVEILLDREHPASPAREATQVTAKDGNGTEPDPVSTAHAALRAHCPGIDAVLGHAPRALLAPVVETILEDAVAKQWIEQQLAQTGLRAADFRNGAHMELEPAREMLAAFVAAARTMLGDAPNYMETPVEFPSAKVEMDVKVAESAEMYTLVVQRHASGALTPHQARERAEAQRDEILAIVSAWCQEANNFGGVDAGDLAWRLERAGHPLPADDSDS